MTLALPAHWLARLAARRDEPPRILREPLFAGDALIGSVEPDFFPKLALPPSVVRARGEGWEIAGDVTASLGVVARAMRDAGLAHTWRDEQLPVTDALGRVLGTMERATVRPLGITTFAVHLAGFSPDARHWVQQRSLAKATDPGLWDTLMGGMVPATDTLQQALERETWEEAGLRLEQVGDLRHRGRVLTRPGLRAMYAAATSWNGSTGSPASCPPASSRATRMARSNASRFSTHARSNANCWVTNSRWRLRWS